MKTTLGTLYLNELEAEAPATRHALERVPDGDPAWKPHEKSMEMAYLAYLVAEMPRWIAIQSTEGLIDFKTFAHEEVKDNAQLLAYFDRNMDLAREALRGVTDEQLENEHFVLKDGDQELMRTPKGESVGSTINHLVHHRAQLGVYLRLRDIAVPSMYGPSADEKGF